MASELLKNRALIQRLKEPKLPDVDFSLSTASFESTLPEPKPQELLDIQENVRIQRQQDTMNKARPFLMDESVDFIERQEKAIGGGLIHGKNLGTREGFSIPVALAYLKKLPAGSIIEDVDTLAAKLKMSDNPLRTAMKQLGIKSRYEVDRVEGTMFKIKNDPKFKKQFIKDAKTRTPAMIQNDYNVSKTSFDRLKKDLNLKSGKDYVEDRGVPTPKPEVTKNANKLLKLLKKDKSIKNFSDVMEKTNFSDLEAMSAIRALNKNLKIPQIKGEIGKPGVIKTRFDIPANLKNKISKIEETLDRQYLPFEEELKTKKILSDKDIKNLFSAPSFKLREYLEKGSEFEHALPKSLISFVAKNKKEADALYITGSRTSPFLNSFKRKFDLKQKSLVQQFLDDKISLSQYNSQINKIRKTIKNATGGYETGYIKFDKNKNPTAIFNATSVKEPLEGFGPRTSQTIKALDNVKFTSNLLKNYKKNKNNPIYNSLKLKGADLDDVIENYGQINNEYKKVKPLLSNKKGLKEYAKENLQNPVIKLLFQSPYGKAGSAITGAAITSSKLAADEGDGGIIPTKDVDGNLVAMELPKTDAETLDEFAEEEGSLAGDIGAGAGFLTGAAAATPKGKEGAKKVLSALKSLAGKGIGLGFGPTGLGALTYGFRPEEGYDLEDPLTRLGFEAEAALAPSLVRGATEITEKIKNPLLRKIAERGSLAFMSPAMATRAARIASPLGIASLVGEGLYGYGKFVADELERIENMTPEEREAYNIAEQEQMEVAAAEGGRIGFKDGPKDPSKRLFLKVMGGIASLPVVGKLFKGGAPMVEKLVNTPTKMPDWFPNFIDKFIGRSIGKKIDADLMEYKNPDLPGVTVTRSDDGRVYVEGTNEYNETYQIEYEPPGYELVDPKTGQSVKTPGNFEAVEGRHVAVGPEDYDVEAYYPEDLDEIAAGDIRAMEKYTTGKVSGTVKDTMGKDTGLKKGEYDLNMAEGRAEAEADIARDLDDYYED